MHEIDEISIGDVNYDNVCLNCRHWRVEVQLKGSSKSVVCTKGQGHTNPSDTCAMFSPNPSLTASRTLINILIRKIRWISGNSDFLAVL